MLLDELAARLVSLGIGTIGASIFLGSKAIIPVGDGPFITLTETGGSAPTRIHNKNPVNTQRPTAQIAVRAKSYLVARQKAKDAYAALDGVYNTSLSGVLYHSITARQEPTDIGLDDAGRPLIVFNVECEKAYS